MAIRCARGTKDVLSADISLWHLLENTAVNLAESYGYTEIRTPMFESVDLFTKGLGANAGLVERELWTFNDKDGKKLALRADMTLPVMRAYNEHDLGSNLEGPLKLYYMGPVFLVGKGRNVESRQVHQFGLEALGVRSPEVDAEVIKLVCDMCKSLGLKDVKVELNSLGCDACNREYQEVLKNYFAGFKDQLCPTCKKKYSTNPVWTLGCDEASCKALSQVVPSIFGYLCKDCGPHFEAVKKYLEELKVPFVLNPLIVKDTEHYNSTIFRITCSGIPIAFGGRYDNLSEFLGNDHVPAVGCTIDIESLVECALNAGLFSQPSRISQVCLAGEDMEATALLLPCMYALREAGVTCEMAYPMDENDTPLKAAQRSRSRFVITLESSNYKKRNVTLYEQDYRRETLMKLESALAHLSSFYKIGCLHTQLRPNSDNHIPIARRRPHKGIGLEIRDERSTGKHHLKSSLPKATVLTEKPTRLRRRRKNEASLKPLEVEQDALVEFEPAKESQAKKPLALETTSKRPQCPRRPEFENSLETKAVAVPKIFAPVNYSEPVLVVNEDAEAMFAEARPFSPAEFVESPRTEEWKHDSDLDQYTEFVPDEYAEEPCVEHYDDVFQDIPKKVQAQANYGNDAHNGYSSYYTSSFVKSYGGRVSETSRGRFTASSTRTPLFSDYAVSDYPQASSRNRGQSSRKSSRNNTNQANSVSPRVYGQDYYRESYDDNADAETKGRYSSLSEVDYSSYDKANQAPRRDRSKGRQDRNRSRDNAPYGKGSNGRLRSVQRADVVAKGSGYEDDAEMGFSDELSYNRREEIYQVPAEPCELPLDMEYEGNEAQQFVLETPKPVRKRRGTKTSQERNPVVKTVVDSKYPVAEDEGDIDVTFLPMEGETHKKTHSQSRSSEVKILTSLSVPIDIEPPCQEAESSPKPAAKSARKPRQKRTPKEVVSKDSASEILEIAPKKRTSRRKVSKEKEVLEFETAE